MNSELFDEESVKVEAKRHDDFWNTAIGLLTFGLALTCVSFPNPQRSALVCLGIIIPVFIQARNHLPPTIVAIRELARETDDPHVKEVKVYLEKKYLGLGSVLKNNFIYWYGFSFFLAVLLKPEVLTWLKT